MAGFEFTDVPASDETGDILADFHIPAASNDGPKKRGRRPRAAKEVASSAELSDLIEALHAGIAKIPGQSHWSVDKVEADSVAKPLSRVLARQGEVSRWAGEHADSLLLVFAVCSITIPRAYVSFTGGTKDAGALRSSERDTRPTAGSRLLRPNERGESNGTTNPSGNASRIPSAANGHMDDPTADAVRDSLAGIPF